MKMKVKCVGYKEDERAFTKGKIYTWEDDKLVNDIGFIYSTMVSGTNIDNWSLSNWYKFKKVEDNEDKMTDEEIFDMLKDKMEKNEIRPACYKSVTEHDFFNEKISTKVTPLYSEDVLIKAVSLAYTVGYKRAEKGRPFKYRDRK